MSDKKVTIEMIEAAWAYDSRIDKTDLVSASANQLELHNKYHKILNWAKKRQRALINDKARLNLLKHDYYTNQMAPIQMKELGWEPNRRTILKGDIDKFIEADPDVIAKNLEIGEVDDIINFVE